MPEGDWELAWADEFDGTELDRTKWDFRLNFFWGGQDGIWPFGELKEPKFVHRFGYYECRCKFPKYPEIMWSAFWMQSPTIGARFEPEWCGIESDIMECFRADKVTSGNIMGGYFPL